jgi:hypothetical protein
MTTYKVVQCNACGVIISKLEYNQETWKRFYQEKMNNPDALLFNHKDYDFCKTCYDQFNIWREEQKRAKTKTKTKSKVKPKTKIKKT